MRHSFDPLLVGVAALLCLLAVAQVGDAQPPLPGNQNLPNPNVNNPNLFTGTGTNVNYGVNMAPWGPEMGDKQILANMQSSGQTIDLHTYFPFYGGLYNYSTISIHGYVAFATVLDQGPTINVGPLNTDWPRQQDPAMIAPYLCKQQVAQGNPGVRSGVYYRVVMRQSMFGQGNNNNLNYGNSNPIFGNSGGSSGPSSMFGGQQIPPACQGAGTGGYVQCNAQSDLFLDEMMRQLQEGVAGASAFRADAALVVTWYNTASAIVGRTDMTPDKLSSYQVVWLTDRQSTLSYTIINYDKLGFDAADFGANSRNGRCQALFNGGNHTGIVPIDPTEQFKNSPKVLSRRSGVPHVVRGRYMFRVDDLVRPAGCSNKTGGTFPLMIYPNIINMLGEMTVEVNGLCMDAATTYVLMIEQRPTGACTQINPAIARCTLPKVFDWGTKTVYFQPQSGGANDEKAYVGYIYFVPPTIDPMRLDIGNVYEWFKNPMTMRTMPISWYPRNFTNPDLERDQTRRVGDDSIYSVQLGLYVIGYKEFQDDTIKKFRPEHKPIALLGTISNNIEYRYRWQPQQWMVNLDQVERWLISDWDRANDLFTYRLGYLKLAPMRPNDPTSDSSFISGLVSAPISLHWLWTNQNPGYSASSILTTEETERRTAFVAEKAMEMCHDWYNEDGAQWNFIHDTETNASCPCVENQAKMDLGRFMPHPRCSQTFRDVTCTTSIGARNCYMSAQNIYGSSSGINNNFGDSSSRFATHYGQVCCYDDHGTLMQTSYQPVIKTTDETPYSPGFPMRAYEFGTEPYQGQFQVPGLSAFYHDQMPYFLCCKYAKFRCQLFYWRRPSSGCQAYQPPAIGYAMGAGTFNTIDNQKFIFNEPGVYTLLYIPETAYNPMVRIQIRLERYPNRKVDFSLLGLRLQQEDLVQPTNATVITAIALESSESDRVHILARKDTRRMRYRTSIIVGNILRYFDTMKLQRYRGVLIYVNNVQRGQSEVYVVLEKAQIGLRIRESYGMDIDRLSNYQESMGMLDISLSVPPQYGVRPDGTLPRETDYRTRFDLPKVQGLMRPFPDAGASSYPNQPLNINNDVNNDGIRQQLISQYRVSGSGEQGSSQSNFGGQVNRDIPQDNMFVTSRDEDKQFDAFPDAALKSSPIYETAPQYQTGYNRFSVKTGQAIVQFLENCRNYESSDIMNIQPQQSDLYSQIGLACPDNSGEILQMCGDNAPCLYDATLLQSKVLGTEAQDNWNAFNADRFEAVKQYNSCGAINIEYPEYLLKTPAMSSGYLQNDVARFECFQSHWIKGDTEYKCSIVEAGNDPYNYRFEWNKGWQPWCRSREKDNLFSWMRGIFIALGIIIILVLIFLCFWCAKRRRIDRVNSRRTSVSGRPPYYQKNGAYIPAGQKVPLPAEKNEVLVFENTPKAQMYSNGKGAKDLDDPHHGPAPNRANSSPPLHTDRPEWRDYPNRPPSGYSTPPRYNTPPYQNGNPAFQGFSNTRV